MLCCKLPSRCQRNNSRDDIPAMAAACAFHIGKNHPFVDGNKRAVAAAMIAFLSDNGWSFDAATDEAASAIIQLVTGTLDKAAFTDWAREQMHEKPRLELREFFAKVRFADLVRAYNALPRAAPGSREEEFLRTAEEAKMAMPVLCDAAAEAARLAQTGDVEGLQVNTAIALTLIALFRVAEDMDYEW